MFDLERYLVTQRQWSEATFGPGDRAKGVVAHIRKELDEIAKDPTDLMEWIDVAILAFDGAWRAGPLALGSVYSAAAIVEALEQKQRANMARQWPDWRTMPLDQAIEHVRAPSAEERAIADESVVAGDRPATTRFVLFLRAILAIKHEQAKANPDNALIDLLAEFVRYLRATP